MSGHLSFLNVGEAEVKNLRVLDILFFGGDYF